MPYATRRPAGRVTRILSAVLLTVALPQAARAGEKPIWLVVTRPMFQKQLAPLVRQREKDGFRTVVSTEWPERAIRRLGRAPAFVLIVEAAEATKDRKRSSWHVSTWTAKLYRWRAAQRHRYAADALWGDLNGDRIPDMPVGRIPARTPDQLKIVVDKILAFERRKPTLDDLRMPAWAGAPGYNETIDRIATGLGVATLRTRSPRWLQPSVISADPKHPLCGWPMDQPETFVRQFRRGGAMAILMGHGSVSRFYSMRFQRRRIGFAAADARRRFAAGAPGPPMVVFACDSGDFTRGSEALTVALLLAPGGPVAAIGATTESHPLTNYFSAVSLLDALGGKHERLGSLWHAAQLRALKARNFFIERLLRDVEGKLEENINVAGLRADQVLLYALLGDPATRLHLPGKLHGKLRRRDGHWTWRVRKPAGATKLLVGFRPARPTMPPLAAGPLDPAAARERFRQANAAFAFAPLAELAAEDAWTGTIGREGTLRFVARAGEKLHVAALVLKTPATQPAGSHAP